jgi:uncharacterized membrane-anchored protein YitT (DUF2179 family)
MIDGGVTGLSILAAQLSHWPLGLFLLAFNVPFIFYGYKKFGRGFACYSIVGIVTLAALTLAHVPQGFTDVPILAAVFGGMSVGVGVGLVVRYGGIIDGMDTVAVLIDRTTVFSVSEAILAINGLIICLAGFVFGWENALYSLIAYFVAHKAIAVTVEGLDESRSVWIVSNHIREIGQAINEVIGEPVTYIKESGSSEYEPHGVLLVVITRLEEQKAKMAIRKVDPMAYIVITSAHEVLGKISENSLERSRSAAESTS